jgi:hypothetical protein
MTKYEEIVNENLVILRSLDRSKYWELTFWVSCYTDIENLNTIKRFLLDKETEVLEKYPGKTDAGTGLGIDSTTARYSCYNLFLEYPTSCLQNVKNFFVDEYNNYINSIGLSLNNKSMTAWYNILRYNQQIEKHFHGDLSRASANFTVDCYNTSTIYELPYECGNYEIINKNGTLTIFNSLVPHWTTKNLVYKERISIAADFYDMEKVSQELENVRLTFK